MKKLKLIDNWKQAYKLYSVQIFALIAAFPTLYNELVSLNLLDGAPSSIMISIRLLAIIGLACRMIKQDVEEKE